MCRLSSNVALSCYGSLTGDLATLRTASTYIYMQHSYMWCCIYVSTYFFLTCYLLTMCFFLTCYLLSMCFFLTCYLLSMCICSLFHTTMHWFIRLHKMILLFSYFICIRQRSRNKRNLFTAVSYLWIIDFVQL